MPKSCPQPCANERYGCRNKRTQGSYCDDCAADKKAERQRSESDPRYHTAAWTKYTRWFKRRNPICSRCGRNQTKIVHHIVAVTDGGDFWDTENHDGLCFDCHEIVEGRKLEKS